MRLSLDISQNKREEKKKANDWQLKEDCERTDEGLRVNQSLHFCHEAASPATLC